MIPSVSLTFDLQCLFSICNPISLAIDFITLVVAMNYSNLANSHFLLNIENAIFCYHGNCFCEYLKMLKDAKLAPVRFGISTIKLPNINQKNSCHTPCYRSPIYWTMWYEMHTMIPYHPLVH